MATVSRKLKFGKLRDWLVCTCRKKDTMKNVPLLTMSQLAQIGDEPRALLSSDDSIQIPLQLAWIVTFTVQAFSRKLCMESWEHDSAYISSPICINWLFFQPGAIIFFYLYIPTTPKISPIQFLWRHHFFFSIIVLCAVFMGGWRLVVILLPSRAFNWRWCVIEYIYYTPRK